MYINLFISINKNMFFEKYKFISLSEKKKKSFYAVWFFIQNYVFLMIGTLVIYKLFKSTLVCGAICFFHLISGFFQIDSNDWKAFERNDFVMAFPQKSKRCFMVLVGNLIYRLFISNNIVFYGIITGLLFGMKTIGIVCFIMLYLIIYMISELVVFTVRYSIIGIKKFYSIFGYIFSMSVTSLVIYAIFQVGIYLATQIIKKQLDKDNILAEFELLVGRISIWFTEHKIVLASLAAVFALFITASFIYTLYVLKHNFYSEKDKSKYVVKNFRFIRFFRFLMHSIAKSDNHYIALSDKEYALYADVYKFNYKNYWYVMIADRPLAIMIAVIAVLYDHMFEGCELLLLGILPCFFMLDINSATTVKLLVNMSFISDYNTILFANTSGISLKELIRAKLRFYYVTKSVSTVVFFITSNLIMYVFGCEPAIYILTNLLCLIILIVFPENYLISNLIYTRLNYKQYEKYLDESQILEVGSREFFPLNLLYRVMTTLVFLALIVLLFGTRFSFRISEYLIMGIMFSVFIIGIFLCRKIMKRVGNNILAFVERGDYSADFAKIFKK